MYGIDTQDDFVSCERGRLSRKIISNTIPGALALALSGVAGVWMLYMRPPAPELAKVAAVAPTTAPAENPYGALFDPRASSGGALALLSESLPLQSSLRRSDPEPAPAVVAVAEPESVQPAPAPAQAVAQLEETPPLPTPRPAEFGRLASHSPLPAPSRRLALQQSGKTAPPATSADNRSFFDKLFGNQQPSGPVLAYAAPENVVLDNTKSVASSPSPRYERGTAIYDISAHTVYLPNGTRLEAHSGLGDRLDDPRYVNERMRGATPPTVYELSPREAPFHGVRALRLTPLGGQVYGRTGLLAHTYMLGPNGASNGCVSFRNYTAFLQAYQSGEIKRLAVVSRMN